MDNPPTLANRLAVHICHDLAKHAPKTLHALDNWLDHCGCWLAELARCPRRPDQVPFMVGLLGLSLSREMDLTLPDACQVLRDHMKLHLLTKEATS